MSLTDARRAKWRADLHEFGAASLDGAGLTQMSSEHLAEALSQRAYASLMEELAAAKAGNDPEALKAIKHEVRNFRQARRADGPPTVGLVNNFTEPSDDELIAQGY